MEPSGRESPVGGRRFPRVRGSIFLYLFLPLAAILLIANGANVWFAVRSVDRSWMQSSDESAALIARMILRSTREAMLANRTEEVRDYVHSVASTPGVAGLRIYDKLGRIVVSTSDSEVGAVRKIDDPACVPCHPGPDFRAASDAGQTRAFERAPGHRQLARIEPIVNEPACSSGGCHVHRPEDRVLGVLEVRMSLEGADALLAAAKWRAVRNGAAVTLLAGLLSWFLLRRLLHRPVRKLIDGVQRVSRGDLEARVDLDLENEIGELGEAFNRMTGDLRRAHRELTEWSQTLERKVMEKTEELGRTQSHVVHMDKMASLGKLAATVAHELNNPLAGILNYTRLVERDLSGLELPDDARTEIERCLGLVRRETQRSGDIVRSLLLFAKPSGGAFVPCALDQIVDRALMLVRHHAEVHQVRIEHQPAGAGGSAQCDPDQIQQALVALCVNAIEAMPHGGILAVRADLRADEFTLAVEDTGVGIPADVLPRIFEPFFSTKEGTSGVGLGLAVVHGIVQRHGGRIDVESSPGAGTRFSIVLPRRQEHERPTAAAVGGPVR